MTPARGKLCFVGCLALIVLCDKAVAATERNGDVTGAGTLGSLPVTTTVDAFVGSANASYSLTVPPGRSGLQPALGLYYNSGNLTVGMLGKGWDLDLPFIQRSTKHGEPGYTWQDRFSMRWGTQLHHLVQVADYTTNGVGVREYRTERQTFMRIRSTVPATAVLPYWEVFDGTGKRYQFGRGTRGKPNEWAQVNNFLWALNLVVDQYGNYMELEYLSRAGVLYPTELTYTGNYNGLTPQNKVTFTYEDRHDVVSTRIGGTREWRQRLRQIKTFAGASAVTIYTLAYSTPSVLEEPANPSSFTAADRVSLLTQVTKCDGSGISCLPPVRFTYQLESTATKGWGVGGLYSPSPVIHMTCTNFGTPSETRTINDKGVVFDDPTLSGWASGIQGFKDQCDAANSNRTGGLWDDFVIHLCDGRDLDTGLRLLDINGDRYPDMVRSERRFNTGPIRSEVRLNTAASPVHSSPWGTGGSGVFNLVPVPFVQVDPSGSSGVMEDSGVRLGDVNGDGLVDLVQSIEYSGGCRPAERGIYLNHGGGWSKVPDSWNWTIPVTFVTKHCGSPYSTDNGARLIDVNGDGMADIIRSVSVNGTISRSLYLMRGRRDALGTPWELVTDWPLPSEPFNINTTPSKPSNATRKNMADGGVRFGDVNGDGMVDIIVAKRWNGVETKKVYLHRGGKGWEADPEWASTMPFTFIERLSSTGQAYDMGVRLAPFGQSGVAVSRWLTTTGCGPGSPIVGGWASRHDFADLLVSIDNGMGGVTSFTYGYSTQSVDPSLGGDNKNQIGFVIPIVRSITTTDGLSETQSGSVHSYTRKFSYYNGYYKHGRVREFRGFGRVITRVLSNNTLLDVKYVQDRELDIAPLAGAVERVADLSLASPVGSYQIRINTYRRADRTTTDPSGNSVALPPPYFDFLESSDAYVYAFTRGVTVDVPNPLPTPVKQTRTAYSYTFDESAPPDRFITSRRTQLFGDLSRSNDDLTVTEEYINSPLTGWKIGLIKRRSAVEPVFPFRQLTNTWFLYDGIPYGGVSQQPPYGTVTKGNVTSIEEMSATGIAFPGSGLNRVTRYDYDGYGNLLWSEDAEGHRKYFDYRGTAADSTFPYQVRVITTEGQRSTEHRYGLEYDLGFGTIRRLVSPADGEVNVVRDSFGRVSKIYKSTDSAGLPTECYTYDLVSRPAKIARFIRERSGIGEACGTNGMMASVDFVDGMGRVIETKVESTEPVGGATVLGTVLFNAEGRIRVAKNPFRVTTPVFDYTTPPTGIAGAELTYDPIGRRTSVTLPGINGAARRVVRYEYPGWTVRTVDPELKITEVDVDGFGRISERRTYYAPENGGGLYTRTALGYDRLGRLTTVQDTEGNSILYQYDALGQLLRTSQGGYTTDRIYNPDGTLRTLRKYRGGLQTLPQVGLAVEYTYDELHRPLSVSYYDGSAQTDGGEPDGRSTVLFHYDQGPSYDAQCGSSGGRVAVGHLTSVEDDGTGLREEFLYDTIGRPSGRRQIIPTSAVPGGRCLEVRQSLDAAGRVESITYPDQTVVSYVFGADGRVSAVPGIASNIRYNEFGNVEHINYANGVQVLISADPQSGVPRTVKSCTNCGLPNSSTHLDATYEYAPAGHISSIVDRDTAGAVTNIRTFGLDHLYRVVSADATAADSYHGLTYAYDAIGNLTSKEGTGFQYGGPHPHQVTSSTDGYQFSFGNAGELRSVLNSSGAGRTYRYDALGEVSYVADSERDVEAAYTYDPHGYRVRRWERRGANTEETLFAGEHYQESDTEYRKLIFLDGQIIAEVRRQAGQGNEDVFFYVGNEVGGTSVVTDASGGIVQKLEYRPYGEISRVTGENFSAAFGFAGSRADAGTGLQDFGLRLYDPKWGRFLTTDPVQNDILDPMNLNPYGYAGGNPVSARDVGGLSTTGCLGLCFEAYYYYDDPWGSPDSGSSGAGAGLFGVVFGILFGSGGGGGSGIAYTTPVHEITGTGTAPTRDVQRQGSGQGPHAEGIDKDILGTDDTLRLSLSGARRDLNATLTKPLIRFFWYQFNEDVRVLLEPHGSVPFVIGDSADIGTTVPGRYDSVKKIIFINSDYKIGGEFTRALVLHEVSHYVFDRWWKSQGWWPQLKHQLSLGGEHPPRPVDPDHLKTVRDALSGSRIGRETGGLHTTSFLAEYYQFGRVVVHSASPER